MGKVFDGTQVIEETARGKLRAARAKSLDQVMGEWWMAEQVFQHDPGLGAQWDADARAQLAQVAREEEKRDAE